ncbi:hypothetical protein KGF56_002089 [Candida oxycetoniae]|uniref:PHD-type domain-containing protein n=1 Tax=Candida oxycetoniae TaxID=497107 RepID=A0AAI9WYC2_9ASCO|nr:uncharacterized protein KGF56_002089 [Candida oxycetoniae]KAI3405133.2 hypothetical protein KGF56_002089 [Candida oxycetoniae]
MASKGSSRSSSVSSSTSNGRSSSRQVLGVNGNNSNAKSQVAVASKKRRSPEVDDAAAAVVVAAAANGTGKRKSARIAQLEELTTPKLSASPEFRESSSSDIISDIENAQMCFQDRHKFMEPPLAPPTPGYTGLPLEEFPSAKIKKESLWPQKLRRGKSKDQENNGNVAPDSAVAAPDSIEDEKRNEKIEIERRYINGLQTSITEDITENSELRDSVDFSKPRLARQRKLKLIVKTPKQQQEQQQEHQPIKRSDKTTPKNALKKIKIISPQKVTSTKLLAPDTKITTTHEEEANEDTHKDNDDFCFSCGRPGVFICCEMCPKSFHFTCCDPPIEEPPEDDWFCHECIAKRNPSLLPNWNEIGIFGKLLNNLQIQNPKVFELPRRLREETFIGVTTGDYGAYSDDTEKPEVPVSKTNNGLQIAGFNRNPDLEIETLYDSNGNPRLCHKCGDSGQFHRTLIKCDYCPLIYHVDCLDYPMFGPKTIGDKWRCPNHVADLLPRGLPKMRQFKKTEVIESSLKSNFLEILAMGNFVVKFDAEPFIEDKSSTSSSSRVKLENIQPDASKQQQVLDTWGADMDAIHPEYRNRVNAGTFVTPSGISNAPRSRMMSIPNTSSPSLSIYRIPEKSIILDFINKFETKKEIVSQNQDYDYLSRLEQNPRERELVASLNSIKDRQKQLNLNALLKAAKIEVGDTSKETLSYKEIQDLIKTKKLMEAKGQDALLKFLQS